MTLGHLLAVVAALPVETRHELIGAALGIGGLGGFEPDPRDSASLLELRAVIDDELGWDSKEDEEEANYPARVSEVAIRWRVAEDSIDAERSIAAKKDEQLLELSVALEHECREHNETRGYRQHAESRIAELESENARLEAVVEACVAWQEKFDCYFCALGSPPHAEDCPLVVGGFIEQSGGRVK